MRILVITPGDPDGIGAEITWRAIQQRHLSPSDTRIVCIGARAPFEKIGASIVTIPRKTEFLREALPPPPPQPAVFLLEAPTEAQWTGPAYKNPRRGFHLAGFQSGWSVVRATQLIRGGAADALVTGPISKERLKAGGYAFPGHTELLARLCRAREVTMMLANDRLRVSLVTTHLPLKDVSRALKRKDLQRAIRHTAEYLIGDCGITQPRIAVAGLNPHAGENGLLGQEEQRVIAPVIRAFQKKARAAAGGGISLTGPLPADTLFAKHVMGDHYDAIVCMYHDQGLIPVKLLDFPRTVNVSLGLPIIRTSVDHGVAFDIVGTGKADPSSLMAAIDLAERLVDGRRKAGAND